MKQEQNLFPPALERAIHILDKFSSSQEFDFSIKEIADELSIPYASAYRIIKCLTYYGYLGENIYSREKYRLGYKLISLGRSALGYADFVSVATPYLASLSAMTKQACKLSALTQTSIITLDQVLPQNGIALISKPGEERPIDESASGKILVALLPKTKRTPYIKKAFSCHNQKLRQLYGDEHGFDNYLDEIRERGYGISIGEYGVDIGCLAVPLFDYTGRAIAALTLNGQVSSYSNHDSVQTLLKHLEQAKNEISKKLGYSGNDGEPAPVLKSF